MATPNEKCDHYLGSGEVNMKTTLGPLKLCLVGAVVAVGVGSAQARSILGHGLTSCGAWTQARTTNAPERLSMEHWVAGYLSNFNSLNDEDSNIPDLLKDQKWDGLMGWIDTYCAAHPLDKVDRAARTLELELLGQHLVAPR
jgi:hypothetical protein